MPLVSTVGTGLIFLLLLVMLRLVENRNWDKIAVLAFWTYILFSILQTPNYFPEPLNFEAIGIITVAFVLVWLVYTKRATRSMLPSKGFLYSVASALIEFFIVVLFILVAETIIPPLELISTNSQASIFVGGFPLGRVLSFLILVLFGGTFIGIAFIFASDAIGRITGEWRIWIRGRKPQPSPKQKTPEEIEDERIEKIISGVLRRLKETT